jgi:glycosyltransferase involved in cell wall biosynthesis
MFSPWFTRIPVIALPSSFEAEGFAKLYHLPFHWVEKFGLRFYKYAIPLGKDSEVKIKEVNKSVLSKVIPEGVAGEYFAIKKVSQPKHILFLGRFDVGQKGIDLLLEAYAKAAAKINYPLVLAGMGPDEKKVKELIKQYSLQNKVRLIGPTYGKKKFKVLAESLFVVLPSRHETFSCFGLEALASGNPLVTFNISGLGWTNSKIALRAKPFNTNDLSEKMLQMSDKKTALNFSKSGREFAKKYTWEKVTDDLIAFCQKVLKIEQSEKMIFKNNFQLAGGKTK